MRECGFEEIPHPPYSPDMAPSDHFLFPKLKKDLRGRKFADENKLKQAVWDHFADKTSDIANKRKKQLSQNHILINKDSIPYSKEIKYLGISFDNKLRLNHNFIK